MAHVEHQPFNPVARMPSISPGAPIPSSPERSVPASSPGAASGALAPVISLSKERNWTHEMRTPLDTGKWSNGGLMGFNGI